MPMTRRLACLLCLALLSGTAYAGDKEIKRATEAVRVLDEIMKAPDKGVPDSLMEGAEAIVIIPDEIHASLVIGGRRGRGLLAVRGHDGTWSNPVFVTATGGSIGLQAGVQSIDVILVFRSRRGVDSIVNGKFTLGADAAVAAGPVGRNASASTDAQLKAEIFSYSRTRGLFAGVALDGTVLSIDHDSNQEIYGADVTPRRILEGGVRGAPDALVEFRDRLEEYTAK